MTGRNEPKISIVILNWNGKALLKDCLLSLQDQSYENYETIVVDNASTDGSVEYVRKNFPNVRVIANSQNYGFPKGNNIGTAAATGDYVLLLNNDVIAHRDMVRELAKKISKGDVMWGPSIYIPEDVKKTGFSDFIELSVDGNAYRGGLFEFSVIHLLCELVTPSHMTPEQRGMSFFTPGCAVMFDRRVIEKPFDDDYFFYGEDTYLALQARIMGYPVKYVPDSKLIHLFSRASEYLSPKEKMEYSKKMEFYGERNRLLNIFSFYGNKTLLKLMPLMLFHVMAKIIQIVATKKLYKFESFLKAYAWVLKNRKVVMEKRMAIQAKRRASDDDILKSLSCKLSSSDGVIGRIMNGVSRLYCAIVGLRTVEFYKG